MLWVREAMIRTFMQLELEACQEEIAWMIACHNCEALNRPLEEYPARPLSIPPNYIDNLHSRLIKVQQGVLPPTQKVAVNTIVPRSPFFLSLYLKTQTVTHIRKNAVEYLRQ